MNKAKKVIAFICLGILTFLMVFGGAYVGLGYYYQKGFSYGTWINGEYCTGLTVAEVNEKLIEKTNYENIIILHQDEEMIFDLSDLSVSYDFTDKLNQIKNSQNPFMWGYYYFNDSVYEIDPVVSYDEGMFLTKLTRSELLSGDIYNENNKLEIKKTDEEGYVLLDHTKNVIKKDDCINAVKEAVSGKASVVDVSDCYADVPTDKDYDLTMSEWRKIENFQSFEVDLVMADGTKEHIGPQATADWMLLDENGEFVLDENYNIQLDEDKIFEYTASLAEKYDTVNKTRVFKGTLGREITFEGGTYGNVIDQKKQAEAIIELYKSKENVKELDAVYSQIAWCQDPVNDIGDTYIEVDMTAQHMWFYKDGKVIVESDCVTGRMNNGCATPQKLCYIYYMQKSRVLRGPGYASYVNYWMAAFRGIGLHDATWRKEFGGNLYKTGGSHGCVNLPKSVAGEVYKEAELGMPVLLYY